uniref:Dishevelled-binding antagonist of beta-catenin 3a n=1 Tax=Oryzias melastigma TaxID=30732 RepID=A0A3B3CCC7_ORYME
YHRTSAFRSRNKERLEASLSALYELELLKQRQETLVLGALLLGDSPLPGRPPSGTRTPGGHTLQTVSFTEKNMYEHFPQVHRSFLDLDISSTTGFPILFYNSHKWKNAGNFPHVFCFSGDVEPHRCPEPDHHLVLPCSLSTPQKSRMTKREKILLSEPARQPTVSEDTIHEPSRQSYEQPPKTETFGLIQGQAPPMRSSKPRTSLTNEARVVSVLKQTSLCCKDESSRKVSLKETSQCSEKAFLQGTLLLDQAHHQRMGCPEEASSTDHQLNVLHQPGFCHKPRQASIINTPKSVSLDHPNSRGLHTPQHSSKMDSPQHFKDYPSPPALTRVHERSPLEEQLVNAEYVPAHPCQNSSRAHHVLSLHKDTEVSKINQSSNVSPKKCRSNEDRSSFGKKVVKKASRSQVQSNPQRVSDRKSSSVDRDGGRSGSFGKGNRNSQSRIKRQQQSGYKRCQSTQELSQDEADHAAVPDHFVRRVRKSRPTHASVTYYQYSYHHQALECRFEKDKGLCQTNEDESESSASEPDPTESSSLSSDSDESGGLVWPQQLSPQPSPAMPPAPSPGAPLQPKAFVKIKASHALKKKILRFRTGSLKVMTTV